MVSGSRQRLMKGDNPDLVAIGINDTNFPGPDASVDIDSVGTKRPVGSFGNSYSPPPGLNIVRAKQTVHRLILAIYR